MRSPSGLSQLPPLSYLRALWKRKLMVMLVWVLTGALATAIVLWLPAIYRAEVLILVESQRIPERFVTSTVSADLNDRLSNIRQRVMSYNRLLTVINKYDLYREERGHMAEEEIVDLMRSHIDVRLEQGWSREQPAAFRISYEGYDPATTAQVANELGELFIDQNLRSREVNAIGTTEFLDSQAQEAKKRLEQQEALLTGYKRRYNGELPQQESTLNAALGRLQVQLQGAQEEAARIEQSRLLRESEIRAAEASRDALSSAGGRVTAAADPEAEAAERELAQVEKNLTAMRARYTDQHPDVREAQQALAKLRIRLALMTPSASAAGGGEAAAVYQGPLLQENEHIAQLNAVQTVAAKRLKELEGERRRILQEIAALQNRLGRLPLHEQQLAGLMRDYQISQANYQSLLDKKLAAQVATEMERNQKSERFTVLDSARAPERPIKPDRPLLAAAGWVLGLLAALMIALIVELNKNVVLGEWELPAGTPVLGRAPRIVIRRSGKRGALPQERDAAIAGQAD